MLRKAVVLSAFTLTAALMLPAGAALSKAQTAIFAGGCFWCVESDFDSVPGVISTTSGYIGGASENPTYEDHTAAGHREAVRIEFDDARVSYDQLLDAFWHSVDPTDGGGQFCDRGHSYTTAVYAVDLGQLTQAKKSKAAIAAVLQKPIATEVVAAPAFWPAEDYHQDYYRKNPLRYKYYRYACGRDARVEEVWGSAAHQGIAAH
ncbi:MAG: peptide-methionine (S)-S-oxide reductase MsrA [Pseudaminobacter sp.]